MDRHLYPSFTDNWDNNIFRKFIEEAVTPESICLDYRARRGALPQMNFIDRAKFVAGVDPDAAIFENPYLNEAKLIDLSNSIIPYADNTFDIVWSNNVLEHVQAPSIVFNEVFRGLKPGGIFLSKTPNKLHYIPTIARLLPMSFHKFYNKLRGRKEIDTFPTVYMCNTKASITKYAHKSGFEVVSINLSEGRPEYLRLNSFMYLFGFLYERIVNLTDILALFRSVIILVLQKPTTFTD